MISRIQNTLTRVSLASCLIAAEMVSSALAEPRVPRNDSEVLEKITAAATKSRNTAPRHEAVWMDPNSAATEARRLIDLARAESNPRYLGRAQAVLANWWTSTNLPTEIRLLRGTIRQSLHEFVPALDDLSAVTREEPSNAQAWLTLSTLYLVRGDWDAARQAALRLVPLTSKLIAATAATAIGSVNGQLSESYEHLSKILAEFGSGPPRVRVWSWTLLGEMAERLGKIPEAERHFGKAFAIGMEDGYLVGAYADFLLGQGRHPAVIEFLATRPETDGSLLRLAIAHHRTDPRSPKAVEVRDRLTIRFNAARARGDRVHQREEARFCLEVLEQPDRALELARENWNVQREPADIKILLEAALATGHSATMTQAQEWIASTGFHDPALDLSLKRHLARK